MKRKQGRQSGPHRSEDQLTLKDDDRSDRSTIDLTYGEPFEFTFHTYHGVVRFSCWFASLGSILLRWTEVMEGMESVAYKELDKAASDRTQGIG